MRICQISLSDAGGGAEAIAAGLHRCYRSAGYDAWMIVGSRRGSDDTVIRLDSDRLRGPWPRGWCRLADRLRRARRQTALVNRLRRGVTAVGRPVKCARRVLGFEDFDHPATARLLEVTPQSPDVLHAHTLHGEYFDLRRLAALSRRTPTVVTMHDMWLLTGLCHHALDCERWRTGCGACPYLHLVPWVRGDRTAANWQTKKSIYAGCRLHVAAPSRWLLEKIDDSILAPAVVQRRHIPNGVDLETFVPGEQVVARAELGVDRGAIVLLYVGRSVRNHPFKDFRTVREAAARVSRRFPTRPVELVVVGETGRTERAGGASVRFVGDQSSESLARYYRAADVYLHAARAEAFGIVIAEAMACGTPVVATDLCGIPEVVTDGTTGFLVAPEDDEAMASRAAELVDNAGLRRTLAGNAVTEARRRFDIAAQANAYLEWYREIIACSGDDRGPSSG